MVGHRKLLSSGDGGGDGVMVMTITSENTCPPLHFKSSLPVKIEWGGKPYRFLLITCAGYFQVYFYTPGEGNSTYVRRSTCIFTSD